MGGALNRSCQVLRRHHSMEVTAADIVCVCVCVTQSHVPDTHTDRQTDRQRETHRQTDRQTVVPRLVHDG